MFSDADIQLHSVNTADAKYGDVTQTGAGGSPSNKQDRHVIRRQQI